MKIKMIRYSLTYIWLLGIIGQRKVFVNPFLLDTERCQLITPTSYSHGDFCYEFYLGAEVYWSDAKTACEHKGGYLATIDSMNVQNFIMDRLRALGFSHNGIWIGLNDEAEELHWRWADGSLLGSFQYWGSGQSNQFLTHFVEDCVHLRYTDGGQWHDSPCASVTHKYNYICQSNILPTCATTLMKTTASTLRNATTTATIATTTTSPQRTQQLSLTPEQEYMYTETSVSAPTMPTSTTRSPRMPTETSDKAVTRAESTSGAIVQTSPTTTHTDITTKEKETTTTPGSTSTITTTITTRPEKETTTTPISTSGQITTSTMKTTTIKQEKEITMTPVSTTSSPITISTIKTTTSTTAKPTTSTTMKLTTNTATAHTSTTKSRPVTTSTTIPTTMKSTMSIITTTKSTMSTATTTKSTTQLTTGKEVDPCTGFTCKLDCGILGYMYRSNGCPECACAT